MNISQAQLVVRLPIEDKRFVDENGGGAFVRRLVREAMIAAQEGGSENVKMIPRVFTGEDAEKVLTEYSEIEVPRRAPKGRQAEIPAEMRTIVDGKPKCPNCGRGGAFILPVAPSKWHCSYCRTEFRCEVPA